VGPRAGLDILEIRENLLFLPGFELHVANPQSGAQSRSSFIQLAFPAVCRAELHFTNK